MFILFLQDFLRYFFTHHKFFSWGHKRTIIAIWTTALIAKTTVTIINTLETTTTTIATEFKRIITKKINIAKDR